MSNTCIACGQRRPVRFMDGTARSAFVEQNSQVQICTPTFSTGRGGKRCDVDAPIVTAAPLSSNVPMGLTDASESVPKGVNAVKRLSLMVAAISLVALMVATSALAVTVPAVPVSDYGSSLLTELASAIGDIFPYAAAITAFAIGVGMVRRWLGHRKATQV